MLDIFKIIRYTYIIIFDIMEDYMNRLKELRLNKKIKQDEIATIVCVKQNTISNWESERTEIDNQSLQKLADYFNVSVDYLLGRDENKQNKTASFDISAYSNLRLVKKHKVPLLGKIACGEPIFANEDRESYVECGTELQADFCLQAQGDSMIGARILDGDIVFIREQPMVENGEIAAVVIDDVATLKRIYYYKDKNKLILQSANPKYEPFVFIGEELNSIKILGKAIAFQSDVI